MLVGSGGADDELEMCVTEVVEIVTIVVDDDMGDAAPLLGRWSKVSLGKANRFSGNGGRFCGGMLCPVAAP